MRKAATIVMVAALSATTAFAQDEAARKVATEISARVPLEKAITGAPYSAETAVEAIQTLADGNRIARKTTGRVYRDNEGRTRREEDVRIMSGTLGRAGEGPVQGTVATTRTTISIVDPVAGFSYTLDPERKIAWRTATGASREIMARVEEVKAALDKASEKLAADRQAAEIAAAGGEQPAGARGGRGGAAAGGFISRAPESGAAAGGGGRGGGGGGVGVPTEMRARSGGRGGPGTNPGPLERKTLDGLIVEGRKTTTVIPAGQVGNEQPLTIVSEEWRSVDLNILVLTRHSDPRTGESIYRLTNVVRAEPDRSLFMVPSDYTVRDTGVRRMEDLELQMH